MARTIIISVLILLIIAVVYDFILSRNRNKEKFGSDFFLDTMNIRPLRKNRSSFKSSETLSENERQQNFTDETPKVKSGYRKIASCNYGNYKNNNKTQTK